MNYQTDFENHQKRYFEALEYKYKKLLKKAPDKEYTKDYFFKGVAFRAAMMKRGSEFERLLLYWFTHYFKIGYSITATIEKIPEIEKHFGNASFEEFQSKQPETDKTFRLADINNDDAKEDLLKDEEVNKYRSSNNLTPQSSPNQIIKFLAKFFAVERFLHKYDILYIQDEKSLFPKSVLGTNEKSDQFFNEIVVDSNDEMLSGNNEDLKKVIQENIRQALEEKNPINEEFLDIEQASKYTKLKVSTLYDYVHEKKIPFKKLGNRDIFFKEELKEWMKNKGVETKEEAGKSGRKKPLWDRKNKKKE